MPSKKRKAKGSYRAKCGCTYSAEHWLTFCDACKKEVKEVHDDWNATYKKGAKLREEIANRILGVVSDTGHS